MMISASPMYGATQAIAVTATSGSVTLTAKPTSQLLITNAGTTVCFIKILAAAGAATHTVDLPSLGGTQILINKVEADRIVSAVTESGTTTIYVTPMFGA